MAVTPVPTFGSLLLLLVLAGTVLGGVALLVALVVNKRTRPFAFTLVAVGAAIVVLGGVWVGYSRHVAFRHQHELMAIDQHDAADRAFVRALQAHGGEDETRLARAIVGQPANLHGGPAVGARLAWSGVIGLLVLVGVAYALLRMVNNKRGVPSLALFGAGGVALLLLVAVMVISWGRQRAPPMPVAHAATGMTAAQAWEEITRPRIELDEARAHGPTADGPRVEYTVVANGRELTFTSLTPVSEAIDQVREIWLEDGRQLHLEHSAGGFSTMGEFQAHQVGVTLHEALKSARQSQGEDARSRTNADRGPVEYMVVANGRELTFTSLTPVSEAIDRVRKIWLEDGKHLEFDYGVGGLSANGEFRPAEIGVALHQALTSALKEQRQRPSADETAAAAAPIKLAMNGREIAVDAGTSSLELAERIKDEAVNAVDRTEIELNGATMRISAGTPIEVVEQLVDAARPSESSATEAGAAVAATTEVATTDDRAATEPVATTEPAAAEETATDEAAAEDVAIDEVATEEAADEPATPSEPAEEHNEAPPAADPKPLPDWVSQPAKRIGEVYRQVITTDPFVTADECYANFMVQLRTATNEYANTQLGYHGDAVAASGLTPGELASAVGVDEFLETYQGSVGPMKRLHVRVEFDQDFRDRLKQAFVLEDRQDTVFGLSLAGGGVLAVIGGLLGLFKLDEATKGYYTKRLFIGLPVVIISGLTVLGLIWDHIG